MREAGEGGRDGGRREGEEEKGGRNNRAREGEYSEREGEIDRGRERKR